MKYVIFSNCKIYRVLDSLRNPDGRLNARALQSLGTESLGFPKPSIEFSFGLKSEMVSIYYESVCVCIYVLMSVNESYCVF